MKLECCNNKPVVSCKKFGTPENPAVLEDPLSTNKDVINLVYYPSSIVALLSDTKNLQFQLSRLCKIQKERAVGILGTKVMGTNT